MAISATFAASASADTLYPKQSDNTDATSFSTGAQQWSDAGQSCGLLNLIPIGCQVTNGYDGTDGNPSGSLSTKYTSPANALGLLTGNGKLQSPSFTLPATVNGAVFGVDHKLKADDGVTGVDPIKSILPIGAQSTYTITLVDENNANKNVVLDQQTLTDRKATFDHTGKTIAKSSLVPGDKYHILIDTTQTSNNLQAALVNVTTFFDNIRLQVDDGTDALNAPAGATTLPADPISRTKATLNGAIDTQGLTPTTYNFAYGTDQANLGSATTLSVSNDPDGPAAKSAEIAIETCKTYFFRAQASNSKNTPGVPTLGDVLSFQSNCKPDVQTLDPTQVTATGAALNSSVTPRGEETKYHYDLGTSESYGTATADRTLNATRNASIPNNEPIAGLQPNTTYHYRVVASNALGQSEGADKTFTTPAQSGPGATGSTGTTGTVGTPGTPGTNGKTTVVASNQTLSNGDARALLKIRSSLAKVGLKGARKAQIRLPIACSAKAIRTCAGTVKIRTRSKINPSSLGKKQAKRKVTLATFDYQLARGKSGYAIGRSTPEKLRLMRKLKSIAVDISVQVSDAGGTTRQTIVEKGTYRAQKTV